MMKKELVNLNFVQKITITGFLPTTRYVYKDAVKFLGLTLRKSGFRHYWNGDRFSRKQIESYGYFISNTNEVFTKPRITFVFTDGSVKSFEDNFKNYESACSFVNNLELSRDWIDFEE